MLYLLRLLEQRSEDHYPLRSSEGHYSLSCWKITRTTSRTMEYRSRRSRRRLSGMNLVMLRVAKTSSASLTVDNADIRCVFTPYYTIVGFKLSNIRI